MLKLNKTQVSELAKDYSLKNSVIVEKERAELFKKAKASKIVEIRAIVKKLNSLPDEIKKGLYIDKKISETNIANILISGLQPKTKRISRSEYENKIVIASIECNNLKELEAKVSKI